MAFINDFMSLIYPRLCEGCGNTMQPHERYICSFCRASLPRSNYHLQQDNEISLVLQGRVPVRTAASFLLYEKRGRVQNLLHAIKYQEQKELGEYLGNLYADELSNDLSDVDVIVPVPLHPKKLRSRGFNQSEWFAKGLAAGLSKPVDCTTLKRLTDTKTQTRKKKYERWENVEGIFGLEQPAALAGKHVLLVDDVITTGATIEAAWAALRQAPGLSLSVLSIAFASRYA